MPIHLNADRNAAGTPLHHFWNVCVGAGRAHEGLRASWLEQMRTAAQHCGFRHVRFHGLFHDDMFVYTEKDGQAVYNFQYVDDLFDRLLEIGIRPFVELGFCPRDLARETGTVFWWKGHGAPPKDYGKWAELVRRTVAHWVERYGAEEVRRWYFEVWNEPNLAPFFRGTRSEYFELYRVTSLAVKSVDATLRVGGPATSNFVPDARFDGETEDVTQHRLTMTAKDLDALEWRPVWLEPFLAFCAREQLPVDFVSVHPYPTDWALDEHGTGRRLTRSANATGQDLALVRRMVDAGPFPDAEIHLTEWSTSASARDFTHDYLQAATFVVKANLDSIGCVDSLAYWTFTDVFEESGAGETPFHGGFGMINYQGIVKPTFHAYRLLAGLGDEVLTRAPAGIVTRHRATGKIAALAYHFPPESDLIIPGSFDSCSKAEEILALGRPDSLRVEVSGLQPGATVIVETLQRGAGDAITLWNTMGQPASLSRAQAEALRQAGMATLKETLSADQLGRLVIDRSLQPWAVVSVREV